MESVKNGMGFVLALANQGVRMWLFLSFQMCVPPSFGISGLRTEFALHQPSSHENPMVWSRFCTQFPQVFFHSLHAHRRLSFPFSLCSCGKTEAWAPQTAVYSSAPSASAPRFRNSVFKPTATNACVLPFSFRLSSRAHAPHATSPPDPSSHQHMHRKPSDAVQNSSS